MNNGGERSQSADMAQMEDGSYGGVVVSWMTTKRAGERMKMWPMDGDDEIQEEQNDRRRVHDESLFSRMSIVSFVASGFTAADYDVRSASRTSSSQSLVGVAVRPPQSLGNVKSEGLRSQTSLDSVLRKPGRKRY